MALTYLHHRILAKPNAWKAAADELAGMRQSLEADGGKLYGIWRSQIGRPRDELNAITTWDDGVSGISSMSDRLDTIAVVQSHAQWSMTPTLRPTEATPPTKQGNYAFRFFETPKENWDEFLSLCTAAWPGFESSYDSQVIGLWRIESDGPELIRSLLMTRRPDLAMWERSKIPQGEKEAEVRRKLSRRYDICQSTVVYTTTLLTASDHEDTARWT